MINTKVVFNGDKEIAAWSAEDGSHELRVYPNDKAVIGEPCDEGVVDFDDPLVTLKFTSKQSVDAVIKYLQCVSDLF